MRTTIILGNEKDIAGLKNKTGNKNVFLTSEEAEAHLYHIEHPEVDSYIIHFDSFSLSAVKSLIEHIHYLNSIISIVILHSGKLNKSDLGENRNIYLCNHPDKLTEIISSFPEVHRDTNRIEWPVKVIFWKQSEEQVKTGGNILSISSGGCFIRTNRKFAQESLLLMIIKFKDFDLFTEGKVVRLGGSGSYQPEGLAIQFLRISPQTKKCIQNIINEKILGDLMKKLNPDQGTE